MGIFSGIAKTYDSVRFSRSLVRWQRRAARAYDMPLGDLTRISRRARTLRATLDDVLREADGRLALPRIGSNKFMRPADVDWSWRPDTFRGALPLPGKSSVETRTKIGHEVTVFHDCGASELTVRQLRNTREEDLAPFAMRMDVFDFSGSFLSMSLDLPQAAVDGLTQRHLVRMDAIIETESPIEIFARLNLSHGPNTENVVRELPLGERQTTVEFDLGYMDFNEARTEKVWVDLIFERPQMNQVTIRDLTFSRCPRSDM